MLPYIIAFTITNVTAYIGEKIYKKNKKLGIIILILSVLPIILLGGLRTTSLGWDTDRYCVPLFEGLKKLNLKEAIQFLKFRETEFGFGFLIFLLAKIYNNINFILTVLIAIPTYGALYFLYKNKKRTPIYIGLLLFETTLYPIAYSTLRQCVALGIVFVACSKFIEKKYVKAILLILFSSFFHNSYYMAFALLAIIFVNDSDKISAKTKKKINTLVLIAIIVSVCFYAQFLRYLWSIGLISDKYIRYLGSKFESTSLAIRWPLFLYKSFVIIMSIAYYSSLKISEEEKKQNKKWIIMLLIDYVITMFSFKIVNAHRSTYYILFPSLFIFLPKTYDILKKDKFNKVIYITAISIIFILYFITSLRYYSIYPYRGIFS